MKRYCIYVTQELNHQLIDLFYRLHPHYEEIEELIVGLLDVTVELWLDKVDEILERFDAMRDVKADDDD